MNIVVVGYGEMLDALIAGIKDTKHNIVGVFRHENVVYNPLNKLVHDVFKPTGNLIFIRNLGLYDIKANSVNSDKFREEIKRLNTDVIIVGSWSEKFSIQTINTPKVACINVHPSLLPKYRGPNPYTQAIKNGEYKTGITFHLMDVNYDTGAILLQAETDISEEETGLSLKLKCAELAREQVPVLLKGLKKKIENSTSQNEKESSYFHHAPISETIINFEKQSSIEITRNIRAFTPWVQCHIPYSNEFFTFKTYKVIEKISKKPPATIIKKTDDSLFIVCKDNVVMKFSGLRLKRPLLNLFTPLYIKKFVKTKTKAV